MGNYLFNKLVRQFSEKIMFDPFFWKGLLRNGRDFRYHAECSAKFNGTFE